MTETSLPAEGALRAIHEITTRPGAPFPQQVRGFLREGCRQFGLPCGIATRVVGDDLIVEFVGGEADGITEGMALDLCDGFCGDVFQTQRPLGIHDATLPEWRDHPAVQKYGLQCYLGAPIQIDGHPFGTICFFDRSPREGKWLEKDMDLLQLIAGSVQASIEHEFMLRRFRVALGGAARTTGEAFFRAMVTQVAESLGAYMTVVAECKDGGTEFARTLAVWKDGRIEGDYEYEVAGKPCADVLEDGVVYHPHGVQDLYPQDPWLVEAGIEGYVGVAIVGSDGSHLGYLAAFDRKPMGISSWDRWLLDLLAARAGAEIERRRAEATQLHLEREVVHAEKLKSLGVLAGGIAHDFNNLLTGILGNASLALGQLDPGSPSHEFIHQIEQSARRAGGLTKQMLAYSGRGAFEVESVDLSRLVQDISELLGAAVPRSVVLERDLAHPLPLIKADVSQVRQIVMNLIMNASDALEDRPGSVRLRTGRCVVGEAEPGEFIAGSKMPIGDAVFVEVEDDGVGMDGDILRQMFDPFFSTKFAGSGLGLSAVLGIVRGHRGGIQVDSKPGQGTRIRVVFPTLQDVADPNRAQDGAPSGSPTLTGGVLVVDDEEVVLNVAAALLRRAGATVYTAGDGVAGLEEFRRHREDIAIVLLDLTMPRMDGRAVATAIREESPETPVFLMSGYDESAATGHFSDLRLAGFIEKPFQFDELLEKLSRCAPPSP